MSNMLRSKYRYNSHMDTPDLRQLRYFLAVAEELHFGRAAERIGIAQPPLTQQIQKLERQLGCRVFERAVDATRRAARGETGRLRVGAPPSVLLSALPAAIRKYRRAHPQVQFVLREMSTSAIEDAIRRDEIDVGFLRETRPGEPLASTALFDEPVVAVLPASSGLAKGNGLRLSDLRAQPFVFFPRSLGPAFYDKLLGFCVQSGFTPADRAGSDAMADRGFVCRSRDGGFAGAGVRAALPLERRSLSRAAASQHRGDGVLARGRPDVNRRGVPPTRESGAWPPDSLIAVRGGGSPGYLPAPGPRAPSARRRRNPVRGVRNAWPVLRTRGHDRGCARRPAPRSPRAPPPYFPAAFPAAPHPTWF